MGDENPPLIFCSQQTLTGQFGWFVVWLFVFSIVVFFLFCLCGIELGCLLFLVGGLVFSVFVFLMLMILERFVF